MVKSDWKVGDGDSKYIFRSFELAGQEAFLFSHEFLITSGCIYILVFSLLNQRGIYFVTLCNVS